MTFTIPVADPQTAEELFEHYKQVLARRDNPGVFKSKPKPVVYDALERRRAEEAVRKAEEDARWSEGIALARRAEREAELTLVVLEMNCSERKDCPEKFGTLLRVVADVTGVTALDLKSERRDAHTVKARQILLWLCRNFTTMSLPRIGQHVGGRDHSTVIHGVQKVDGVIARLGTLDNARPSEWARYLWEVTWKADAANTPKRWQEWR